MKYCQSNRWIKFYSNMVYEWLQMSIMPNSYPGVTTKRAHFSNSYLDTYLAFLNNASDSQIKHKQIPSRIYVLVSILLYTNIFKQNFVVKMRFSRLWIPILKYTGYFLKPYQVSSLGHDHCRSLRRALSWKNHSTNSHTWHNTQKQKKMRQQ